MHPTFLQRKTRHSISGRHEEDTDTERPVKSTSGCVCEVDEAKITLEVNKIDGFSKLHNFQFEEKGIREWRSYGIGRGKETSFDQLVLKG